MFRVALAPLKSWQVNGTRRPKKQIWIDSSWFIATCIATNAAEKESLKKVNRKTLGTLSACKSEGEMSRGKKKRLFGTKGGFWLINVLPCSVIVWFSVYWKSVKRKKWWGQQKKKPKVIHIYTMQRATTGATAHDRTYPSFTRPWQNITLFVLSWVFIVGVCARACVPSILKF